MGKHDGLIAAALIVGGVIFLPDLLSKNDQGGGSILSGFGTGEGGGLDLSGLFSGLGDMLGGIKGDGGNDQGGLLSGLGDMLNGIFSGLGGGGTGLNNIGDSINKALSGGGTTGNTGAPGTPGAPGQSPSWWNTPIVQPTGNSILDTLNGISQTTMSLAKAGVTGLGIYAGVKVGMPILQKIAPPLANALSKPVGEIAGGIGRGVSGVVNRGIPAITGYLGSPLSELGIAGWAGAVPLAAAAGFGGWELGNWFNKTSWGQSLQTWSGNMGAKVGGGDNILQKILFPHAGVNVSKTDSVFKRLGYSTQDVKDMFKSGMTMPEVKAKLGINKQPTYVNTPKVDTSNYNESQRQLIYQMTGQ